MHKWGGRKTITWYDNLLKSRTVFAELGGELGVNNSDERLSTRRNTVNYCVELSFSRAMEELERPIHKVAYADDLALCVRGTDRRTLFCLCKMH
ncbi:Hypothetical protein FKW44_008713 [Caligus rogercresseyi]|uniref:Reverse transcriptase domain-containing protein n=1 Tax=Caligus rogercresseyi TaxID=217165 RepID=A0A7T8QUG3_CALRO|nr:Hypothetical protein FKW44_008713 [Caligus rogercresseyi]